MDQDARARAAQHWNKVTSTQQSRINHWWRSPHIVREHNRRVCGSPLTGITAGIIARLGQFNVGRSVKRAISVGCGTAGKELTLLQSGLIEHFDLYEISSARVEFGKKAFAAAGVLDRASFNMANAFETAKGAYDLVYWDSSLHHMADTAEAVRWSREILNPGGIILVHDYFGPNRLQWTDKSIAWCNRLLANTPDNLKRHAQDDKKIVHEVIRPDMEKLIAHDPSEAPDSEAICENLEKNFIGKVEFIGGCIYGVGLAHIIWNFHEQNALDVLNYWLMADQLLTDLDERHMGFFVSKK